LKNKDSFNEQTMHKSILDSGLKDQHFKMYKPSGVLSQFVFTHRKRRNRKLLGDAIKSSDVSLPHGIMAIGRLDEDSEGLLLLTTDGQMSKRVREKDVEKEYWVQVRGQVTENAINQLRLGVMISLPASECMTSENSVSDADSKHLYQTLPCTVQLLDTEVVEISTSHDTANRKAIIHDRRRKKFKGTCNKCGESGHKTIVCPMNQNHQLSNSSTGSEDKGVETIKMALPNGIPPSNSVSLAEGSRHGATSWISITIKEGKNRQIRRMTAAVGHATLRLVRVRIGSVLLDGMTNGDLRNLSKAEVESFTTKPGV
jgi:pseudouridine synthase